jgi:MinD-like ATPase involved in chromosome partitioning or flagellar assembly
MDVTDPGDSGRGEIAAMNSPVALNTVTITVGHRDGSVVLRVPADVPVGELMPDFLEVIGQPDAGGWVLGPAGGEPFANGSTFAELGVDDGARLVLHETTVAPPSGSDGGAAFPAQPAPAVAPSRRVCERPLSDRTGRTLPARLSGAARCAVALHALAHSASTEELAGRYDPGRTGPATFTRPARTPALSRIRVAWAQAGYRHRLDQMIVTPRLRRCGTIAVVSPKGGVGKTTTSALLGSLLAFLRRDRVVAVETNPDWGSLGRRLVPDHGTFIDDLLAGPLADSGLPPTELDARLGRGPDGLMVAPAPTDPERAAKLDEAAYRTLFERLRGLVGTIVLDCGTGLDDPPARAALACADQLVLVCDDEPDTASIVSEAAEWLDREARPLVLVVNNLRHCSSLDLPALERATDFARGLAVIPRDERAARQLHDSRFSWNRAPAGWHTPVRELAALVTAGWRAIQIAH